MPVDREMQVGAHGLNRSRGNPHRCGVGVCGRASPWLCWEPRHAIGAIDEMLQVLFAEAVRLTC
jgi:hypothetical protein